jgi:hypothetical protein
MKKIHYLAIVLSVLSFFTSCILDSNCKTGSGDITSSTRKTSYFENIVIKGSCDIVIKKGDSLSVIVKDYSNLIDLIETKVDKNELVVSYKKGTCVSNSKLEVAITIPHLRGVEIDGSGSVKANGNFREPSIHANISGSGDIFFNLTDTTGFLKSKISGSGTVDAMNSVCDSTNAEINGSGDISVNTLKYLKARISGSGTITYKGSPKTDVKVSGSGEVKQK